MKNLIKTANSVVVNQNTPIHNDLTMYYLMLVEELKNHSNAKYNMLVKRRNNYERAIDRINEKERAIRDKIEREKIYLRELGFASATSEKLERYEQRIINENKKFYEVCSEYVEIKKEIEKAEDVCILNEILIRVKRDFGKKALFVRYDDFEKVLNKYNLVCGRLSDYKGVLPAHKMADINRVLKMSIPEFWKDKISKLCSGYDIMNNRDYNSIELRFPFYTFGHFPAKAVAWAPLRYHTFFIAAPAHEMRTMEDIISEQRARDPFICAHTKWGIIIFTKWGEEAEDKIIKKYEKWMAKL